MNYLSVDYLIIYAFLVVTLILGLQAGRGIKDIREYAIGNKNFGTAALILTLLATNLAGASLLHGAARVYSSGIIMTVALLACSISFLLSGLFWVPKVAHFNNCLTMGDLMKQFYGSTSGIIAGFLGLLNATLLVGMELKVLGIMSETLLHIPAQWGIIGGGLLLSLYTAHGGIRSVTVTDIFQFIVLAVFVPIIAYKALNRIGSIESLLQRVPINKLQLLDHPHFSYYLTLFLIWIVPAGLIDPAIIQRMLMAKTGKQLRDQYVAVSIFDPIFSFLVLIIGLSAIVLYPHIEAKEVIPHLVHELLPVGLKGLVIAGILAIGMSTIDSYLHAAGLSLVHDVFIPIWKPKDVSGEVNWARGATIFISIIAIYIGLHATDILGLAFSALEAISPLLMFPFIAGVMGLKPGKQVFYIASIATLLAFIISKITLPKNYEHFTILISLATNGIFFFGAYGFRNKKSDSNKDKKVLFTSQIHRKGFAKFFSTPSPFYKYVINYSQTQVARYDAPYTLLGLFFFISYIIPFFIWFQIPVQYEDILIYLRLIGAFLCILLIFREKWSENLQPYLPAYWHFTVLYCLPFTTTVNFVLTGFNTEWVISVLGITMLLFVVLDWLSALVISTLGVSLGLIFCKVVNVGWFISPDFHTNYLLFYQLAFGLLIGLLFARRREQSFNSLLLQNQQLSDSQQQARKELASVLNYREKLLKELKPDEAVLFDDMTTAYIEQVIYHMSDYLQLDVVPINLDNFQREVLEFCKAALPGRPPLAFKNYATVTEIEGDVTKLKQLLFNAVAYVQHNNLDLNVIYVTFEDAELGHGVVHMPNYTRTIQALKITITTLPSPPLTQPLYKIEPRQASTWIPQTEEEYPLVENARTIDAHYGCVGKRTSQTLLYVLPVKLREVRGKVMELMNQTVKALPEELNHPLAIELESMLLEKIKGASINEQVVKGALEIIKRYHAGVRRKSGEPFFTHPITVALIVLEYLPDQEAVLAALLHDTVEDTSLSLHDIERYFGKTVSFLVAKATNLEDHNRRISLSDKENITRILNYEDPRAALVKLADRLHNMRTIEHHSSLSKRLYIAQETLDKFVPLAHQVGFTKIAEELEELSNAVLVNQEKE